MRSDRIRSAFHWHEFSVNLFDRERRHGVFWVERTDALPHWSLASPLRTLLHWVLDDHGAQLLHGAAFGLEEGALLLVGRGGVGKSTTALAALVEGLSYVADDYLVVIPGSPPTAHALYATAKLTGSQLARFPELARHVRNPGFGPDEKGVLHLDGAFARQLAPALPIVAAAVPRFGGVPHTTLAAGDRDAVARAASFTTLCQLPHAGRALHSRVADIVARVAPIDLALGTSLREIPATIARAIRERPSELFSATPPSTALVARPSVSVIIPTFNAGRLLAHAIESVVQQQYAPLEIIVVDDGSTDDSAAIIAALPHDVRYLVQDNAGPAAARNRGVREATGEVIAFCDADDLWAPGMLAALVDMLLADETIDVARGHAQVTQLTAAGQPGVPIGSPHEAYPHYIGAAVYRRRVFEQVGAFDERLRFGEDSDWAQRASETGAHTVRLDLVTLYVRRHEMNMTRGRSHVELGTLRVFKQMLDRQRAATDAAGRP
jgi:hypothetical protein